MTRLAPDILCLAGCGLVLYMLWMVYPPLTAGAGGLLLAAAGVYLHRKKQSKGPE